MLSSPGVPQYFRKIPRIFSENSIIHPRGTPTICTLPYSHIPPVVPDPPILPPFHTPHPPTFLQFTLFIQGYIHLFPTGFICSCIQYKKVCFITQTTTPRLPPTDTTLLALLVSQNTTSTLMTIPPIRQLWVTGPTWHPTSVNQYDCPCHYTIFSNILTYYY